MIDCKNKKCVFYVEKDKCIYYDDENILKLLPCLKRQVIDGKVEIIIED